MTCALQALDIDDSVHTLWSNRSAAFLAMKDYANAASDAQRALELNSGFIKSYFRLASALSGKFVVLLIVLYGSNDVRSQDSVARERPPKLHCGDWL